MAVVPTITILDLFAKHALVKLAEIHNESQWILSRLAVPLSLARCLLPGFHTPKLQITQYSMWLRFVFVHPLPSPFSLRRMTTGLLELPSMTPSLKMVSWAATNPYAAKCPNWQRNCVNATLPPAQVSLLLWLIHWFISSHNTSVMKLKSVWC